MPIDFKTFQHDIFSFINFRIVQQLYKAVAGLKHLFKSILSGIFHCSSTYTGI